MLFWDTSALVPLLVNEDRSADARRVLREDSQVVTSAITPIEVSSALWRRRHAGILTLQDHERAERRFAQLSGRWTEVSHSTQVFEVAMRLLTRHSLRTLDAIQLGSALVIVQRLEFLPFVTLDEKLAVAARAEGFPVLP